jgi:two-component system sensor histidine kinase/response regulator
MSTRSGFSVKKASPPTGEMFNREEALSRVEGDGELMSSLVDIFVIEAGPMMEAIRGAVKSAHPIQLENTAHKLKGSVSIFCAEAVLQTASAMEQMGRNLDFSNVTEALAQLEQQMASLRPALQHFKNELQASSD